MPSLYTTIGPWTLQTFTWVLALAIVVSAGIGLRRTSQFLTSSVDAYLVALITGVIGARLFHVFLNFDYFADNLNEAFNLSAGGLNWHGAVIGSLIGLTISAWWHTRRKGSQTLPYKTAYVYHLLDTLTPALPLIGISAWYGCLAAGCGYGKEVDTLANYSPLAASELADVFGIVTPRYNTPFFGIALSIVVLSIVLLLIWRGCLGYSRFWFSLALLSAGMFVIGFFRGDHTIILIELRADQWLDMVFILVSCWLFIKNRRPLSLEANG